eukprot:1137346-Pelagomonas_calceolata.AAC.6
MRSKATKRGRIRCSAPRKGGARQEIKPLLQPTLPGYRDDPLQCMSWLVRKGWMESTLHPRAA